MNHLFNTYYKSPVGVIKITATENKITVVEFVNREGKSDSPLPPCLKQCVQQLTEYFSGTRTSFNLPLELDGTDFQKKIWRGLMQIPFGRTFSYGAMARKIKNPKASRAVGMANNKNKIAIIVPCHRVIGSDGSLTGYAGGIKRKEWLLKHESSH